jgi:conjugal transfer pilus assembly protein TraF
MSGVPALESLLVIALASCALPCQAQGSGYWTDAWRGWHFYELPEEPGELEAPAPRPVARPASSAAASAVPDRASVTRPTRAPELLEFERLQKALEELRQIAIVQPSEVNVRRYMTLESQVVARASAFADVARRVAWMQPELDPSLQGRPVNALALEVYDQQQARSRSRAVAALARDHVLLFFFRSDCPYCHAMAPVLAAFAGQHGLRVEAVSVDGGALPQYPQPRADNGIARALQVSQVPALYLAQPGAGRITPIGFGVLSQAQLLERLGSLAEGPPGTSASVAPLRSDLTTTAALPGPTWGIKP